MAIRPLAPPPNLASCTAARIPSTTTASTTFRTDWLGPYQVVVNWLFDQAPLLPGVEAIWLHGSRAVGSHHDASDLDLTFIIDTRESQNSLVEALSKVLNYSPDFVDYFGLAPEPFWSTPDGEVGVHIMDLVDLSFRINSFGLSAYDLEKHQAFVEHTVVKSVAIFDPNKLLERSRKICSSISNNFFKVLVTKYLCLLEQKIVWWNVRTRWKNDFERLSDLAVMVEEISRCHYALNRQLFMPGMKEYRKDLQNLKPYIKKDVLQLIELSPQVTQSKTRGIAIGIVTALKEQFQKTMKNGAVSRG